MAEKDQQIKQRGTKQSIPKDSNKIDKYDPKQKPDKTQQPQQKQHQQQQHQQKYKRGNMVYLFIAFGVLYFIKYILDTYYFETKEDRQKKHNEMLDKFHKVNKRDEFFRQNDPLLKNISKLMLQYSQPENITQYIKPENIDINYFSEQLKVREDYCSTGDAFKLQYPDFIMSEKLLMLIQNKDDNQNSSQKFQDMDQIGENLFPKLQDIDQIQNKSEIQVQQLQMRSTIIEPFNLQNHKHFIQNYKIGETILCNFQSYNTIPGLFADNISYQKFNFDEKTSLKYNDEFITLKVNVLVASTNPLIIYLSPYLDLDENQVDMIPFLQEKQIVNKNIQLQGKSYEAVSEYAQVLVKLQDVLEDSRVFQHFQLVFQLKLIGDHYVPYIHKFIAYPQESSQANLYKDILEIQYAYLRSRFFRIQDFTKKLYSRLQQDGQINDEDKQNFLKINQNKIDALREISKNNMFQKIFEQNA